MAKNRRKSNSGGLITGGAAIVLILAVAAFLGYSALREGGLPGGDAASALRTAVATLPVDVELPADPPGLPVLVPTRTSRPPSGAEGDGVTAYFSDPLNGQPGQGPEMALVAAINAAAQSVDVAVYNISLDTVADALINAHRRGVRVRMVMESEAMERRVPENLASAGISIVGDQREGLMHNKFTIIDNREVWTGSMNYTSTSAYNDFNNLVRVRSAEVVENYRANFEEMFAQKRFGVDKRPNTPYPQTSAGGIPIEVYFSPDDGPAEHVVEELRAARKSIDFLAYSFTRDDFAGAMLAQASGGVRVRGVFDLSQFESNQGGEYEALRRARLDVRLDNIPGLMHHKVIIIDGKTVITGSYNFSANAERTNDENLIIIRDPKLAQQFLAHFEQVYSVAE